MFRWRINKVAPVQDGSGTAGRFKAALVKISQEEEDAGEGQNPVPHLFLFQRKQPFPSSSTSRVVNFHDIVDTDESSLEHRVSSVFVGWLVESLPFRMTMLVVILLNSIIIGIQTDRHLEDNYGNVFFALDKLFLTIFIMEILFKWYNDFLGFWRVGWNVFDFVIVAASLLGPSLTFMSGSRVLRILRVLRALRSLRSISALRGLQIVVHTIMHSIPDMANIVALLLICMFVFAILGFSFFGDNCPRYFGSLGTTMFSLFICVTQDGWMGITEELQMCGNYVLGAIYLLVFITIGAFVFANLVVAVVVTNLEWAIAEQKKIEEKHEHSKPKETKPEDTVTVDASETLHELAHHQSTLEVPDFNLQTRVLENYFLVVSAIEDNLVEFKSLQEQLSEMVQEMRALSALDDVNDDDIFELSAMESGVRRATSSVTLPRIPLHVPDLRRRRFNSLTGDAISNLISMNRRHVINSTNAHSINHLMVQLHTAPSSHSLRITPKVSRSNSLVDRST